MGWRTHHSTGTAHFFQQWSEDEEDEEAQSSCGRVSMGDCVEGGVEKKQCTSCREGIGGRRSWTN
jgi:hypothetical protein